MYLYFALSIAIRLSIDVHVRNKTCACTLVLQERKVIESLQPVCLISTAMPFQGQSQRS